KAGVRKVEVFNTGSYNTDSFLVSLLIKFRCGSSDFSNQRITLITKAYLSKPKTAPAILLNTFKSPAFKTPSSKRAYKIKTAMIIPETIKNPTHEGMALSLETNC